MNLLLNIKWYVLFVIGDLNMVGIFDGWKFNLLVVFIFFLSLFLIVLGLSVILIVFDGIVCIEDVFNERIVILLFMLMLKVIFFVLLINKKVGVFVCLKCNFLGSFIINFFL